MSTRRGFLHLLVTALVYGPRLPIARVATREISPVEAARQAFITLQTEGPLGFLDLFTAETCHALRVLCQRAVQQSEREGSDSEAADFFRLTDFSEAAHWDDRQWAAALLSALQRYTAEWDATFRQVEPVFFGHVADGPEQAHVVYRHIFPRLHVVSLERASNEWRLILPVNWAIAAADTVDRNPSNLRDAWERRQWRFELLGDLPMDAGMSAVVFRIDFACPAFKTTEITAVPFEHDHTAWRSYSTGDPQPLRDHLYQRIVPMSELQAGIALLRGET